MNKRRVGVVTREQATGRRCLCPVVWDSEPGEPASTAPRGRRRGRDRGAGRGPGPGGDRGRRPRARGRAADRRQAAAYPRRRRDRRRRRRGDAQPSSGGRRAGPLPRPPGRAPHRRVLAGLDPRRAPAAAPLADGRPARPRPARGLRRALRRRGWPGCGRSATCRPPTSTATSPSATWSPPGWATRSSTGWSSRCSAGCTPATPASSPRAPPSPSSSRCSSAARCSTPRCPSPTSRSSPGCAAAWPGWPTRSSRPARSRSGPGRRSASCDRAADAAGGSRFALTVGSAAHPELVEADAVVLATPAAPAARLLAGLAPVAAAELAAVEYASMAVVTLAFRAAEISTLRPAPDRSVAIDDCSGFLVPPVDGRRIKAATFSFAKWAWVREAGRGALDGEDLLLLRTSLGRHREESALQATDEELVAASLADLAAATGTRRAAGRHPRAALGRRAAAVRRRAPRPGRPDPRRRRPDPRAGRLRCGVRRGRDPRRHRLRPTCREPGHRGRMSA